MTKEVTEFRAWTQMPATASVVCVTYCGVACGGCTGENTVMP